MIFVLLLILGKPRPHVQWYRNDVALNTRSWPSTDPDTGFDTTNNNVTIESLSRHDVHTKLTCQTSNYEIRVLRTSVELDLKCKGF